MELATILDLLQLVGILLKVFALVVLAVTLAITAGVTVYLLLQALWFKGGVGKRPRFEPLGIGG